MSSPRVYNWPIPAAQAVCATQTNNTIVCATQNTVGAGNLVINGTAASNGTVSFGSTPTTISLSSANDLSGVNFTVTGTYNGSVVTSVATAGPNNNTVLVAQAFNTITNIAVSGAVNAVQVGVTSISINGSLSNSGSVAFIGISRTVSLSSVDNLSTINFTITGTYNSAVVSETRVGPNNNTVYTAQIFDTVTSISSGATVAASGIISVGGNGVSIGSGTTGRTRWFLYDYDRASSVFSAQVVVLANNITYSLQATLDDVSTVAAPFFFDPTAALTNQTVSAVGSSLINSFVYCSIAVTASNATGSLRATLMQTGIK